MRAQFGAKDKKAEVFFCGIKDRGQCPLPPSLPPSLFSVPLGLLEPEPMGEGGLERQSVTTLIYTPFFSLSVAAAAATVAA